MKLSHRALAAAIALATPALTHASLVTWQAPQTITGDSDVVTTGTLIVAGNLAQLFSPTTINGVNFQGVPLGGSGTVTTTAPSSLSSNYLTMLNSAFLVPADDTNVSITLAGLTVGNQYLVQFWVNNSGNSPSLGRFDFLTTISDDLGNSVSLYDGDNGIAAGPGNTNIDPLLGEYVIGTFTAAAGTQTFNFFSGEVPGVVNGVQLRNITGVAAVPEPGTALAGVMLAGLLGVRRRRA